MARQEVYFARLAGEAPPWTADAVLAAHRFTNAYRAADRVSQYLIREVVYRGTSVPDEVVFRTLLFKFFNRIETWEALVDSLGEVSWRMYDFERYAGVLESVRRRGGRIYSAAYVIPPPRLGEGPKHRNHLRLLELMMRGRLADRIAANSTMDTVYELLRSYPSIGDFLAYQFTIDLGYAPFAQWQESDYVVPGPGARDGIRKCFGRSAIGVESDVIKWMVDHQEEEFSRLGLSFKSLWGRSLQLIDTQNLFCEVDKYARVVHPDIAGISGRQRIKQQYRRDPRSLRPWFPPKWNLNDRIELTPVEAPPSRTTTQQLTLV